MYGSHCSRSGHGWVMGHWLIGLRDSCKKKKGGGGGGMLARSIRGAVRFDFRARYKPQRGRGRPLYEQSTSGACPSKKFLPFLSQDSYHLDQDFKILDQQGKNPLNNLNIARFERSSPKIGKVLIILAKDCKNVEQQGNNFVKNLDIIARQQKVVLYKSQILISLRILTRRQGLI